MRFTHKHTQGPVCEGCNERILEAVVSLQKFFHHYKQKYPDFHVAWAYRNKEEQDLCLKNNTSKLNFPKSKHNKLPSLAIDIFQINTNGAGVWDSKFCIKLNREQLNDGFNLLNGGYFKSNKELGDFGHFEVKDEET